MELKLPSLKNFDLTNLKVEASFKQLEVERLGVVEDLAIEGYLEGYFVNLTNLSIQATDLSYEDPGLLSVQSLFGEVSDVKLDIPITQQKVFIALSSKQLSSRKFELKINELKSDLDFENSMIGIGIEMKNLIAKVWGENREIKCPGNL